MSIRYLMSSTVREMRTRGVRSTLDMVRTYVGSRYFPVPADETARRFRLGQRLSQQLGHTVTYGPFTGLLLSDTSWWGAADRGSMLLGVYEQEVLESIVSLSQERKIFVDLGAADGYYAVGAVFSGLFEHAIAFEMSEEGQSAIAQNARRNSVSDRIEILGIADSRTLSKIHQDDCLDLGQVLMLIDIEGAEFELLTSEILEEFRQAAIVVEIHDFLEADGQKVAQLVKNAEEYFNTRWVRTGSRNPSAFSELADWSDDDRWILCSESRPKLMSWLILEPKVITAKAD